METTRRIKPISITWFSIIVVAVAWLLILFVPTEKDLKERRICDQVVETMVTTNNEVELQRSIFLIRHLDCAVTRRMP